MGLGAALWVSVAVLLDLAELQLQPHLFKYRPSNSQVLVWRKHLAFRPRRHQLLVPVSQLVLEVLRLLQASVLQVEPRPLSQRRLTQLGNLPAPLVSGSVHRIGNGKQVNMLQHRRQ